MTFATAMSKQLESASLEPVISQHNIQDNMGVLFGVCSAFHDSAANLKVLFLLILEHPG